MKKNMTKYPGFRIIGSEEDYTNWCEHESDYSLP